MVVLIRRGEQQGQFQHLSNRAPQSLAERSGVNQAGVFLPGFLWSGTAGPVWLGAPLVEGEGITPES